MSFVAEGSPGEKDFSAQIREHESGLIQKLYADVGSANFFIGFMEQLARAANLRSGILSVTNMLTESVAGGWVWNVEEEAVLRYMDAGWAAKDLLLNYIREAEPGRFYSINRHTPQARLDPEHNHVYINWAKPLDMCDAAMALMARQGSWVCSLALHRSEAQRDFSESELITLGRLLPHVQRAVALHSGLKSPQQQRDAISPWLSLIKVPVLLFNERFTCSDQNEAATVFFEQQSALRLDDGWISLDDPTTTREIASKIMAALKRAASAEQSPELSRYVIPGDSSIQLVFLPVYDVSGQGLSTASVLVFIHSAHFVAPLDLSALKSEFGLTDAEAEVCRMLMQGSSVEAIAEYQHKSKETVRSQLKQAFAKTGTTGQAELVVRLLTHPLTLGS